MIEKILQKESWARVAAAALAILMWALYTGDLNPLESRPVYIEIRLSDAQGKVVTFSSPDRVQVTFQGLARTLDKVDWDQIHIPVDVSGLEVGSSQAPIAFVSPLKGVTVEDINPKYVAVSIDTVETKAVGVKIEIAGSPNEEFQALEPSLDVSAIDVSGPRTQVDKVAALVGSVDITGAVETVSRQVTLVARDSQNNQVSGITFDPGTVTVTVPLKARPPAKNVTVQPNTVGTPKAGYRVKSVTVDPKSVKVRGEAYLTQGLNTVSTATVDVSERTSTFTSYVGLVMPSGVTGEVSRVNVTVEIEEDIVKKTYSNVIVQIESLLAGFRWSIEPTSVDITVRGRRDIVDAINPDDVQAFINASWAKEPGSHRMVVDVRGLPDSIRFESITPSQVTLELEIR